MTENHNPYYEPLATMVHDDILNGLIISMFLQGRFNLVNPSCYNIDVIKLTFAFYSSLHVVNKINNNLRFCNY